MFLLVSSLCLAIVSLFSVIANKIEQFDNPNSSTVSYMNNLAGLNGLADKDVYTFKTNNEVLKFVSERRAKGAF